jgi:hypothetical protein
MGELNKNTDFPIVSHHVGGRAGTRGLPNLDLFEASIYCLLFVLF